MRLTGWRYRWPVCSQVVNFSYVLDQLVSHDCRVRVAISGSVDRTSSDVVLETKVLVSRRLEDKKNKVLVLVLRPRVLVLR